MNKVNLTIQIDADIKKRFVKKYRGEVGKIVEDYFRKKLKCR